MHIEDRLTKQTYWSGNQGTCHYLLAIWPAEIALDLSFLILKCEDCHPSVLLTGFLGGPG